ncbi:hypothetical protein Q7C36_013164 [Tachysurus vachellii]|uniref:Chemokine interleukin-8-like domain-containing protein n=1 Tax=Tachysurus vachellii TaxID=175792 RepID=A0AA88SHU7_TACVA|nr:hypothetical protein Q7C36_013164 [Tachysurus vachellii]
MPGKEHEDESCVSGPGLHPDHVAFLRRSHSHLDQALISSRCCSSFFPGKIPPKLIVKVEKTSLRCAKQGFMVTTQSQKLCVRGVSATGK